MGKLSFLTVIAISLVVSTVFLGFACELAGAPLTVKYQTVECVLLAFIALVLVLKLDPQ